MSSNNRISNLVGSQVPFFVRNDHQTFTAFLEAYYEYLEQTSIPLGEGKVLERRENLLSYMDIDSTISAFEDHLYSKFLKDFPRDTKADKRLILKHAKDIFRSKGSEKSVRFMLRAMFGNEIDDVDIYYPKNDILRASDGKWYVQKSLRVLDTAIDGNANTNITGLSKFTSVRITGNVSSASAIVENIDRYYTSGSIDDELVLSSISGSFISGEDIFGSFIDTDGSVRNITAVVVGGIIDSLNIVSTGSQYTLNDPVVIVSPSGQNAFVRIARVSLGDITKINIVNSGAGYQNNSFLSISGGGGTGANANVQYVNLSERYHPKTYNIVSSIISLEANTPIGNSIYSNLTPLLMDPANSWISNSVSTFVYGNTGPVQNVLVINSGSGFDGVPALDVISDNRVKSLGILGRMEILDGGSGYQVGDIIQFIGGSGYGANAVVTSVNSLASDTVTNVSFVAVNGMPVGGSGYSMNDLPRTSIISGLGSNANVVVTATLGSGAQFSIANSTIGGIERLIIENPGVGYSTNTTIDLTGSGDGQAVVTANVFEGTVTYPGRYINDDGFLSSSNYLEDRDYYQPFSYVIRVKQSIENYRSVLKNMVHPAGFKMFGEYLYVNEDINTPSTGTSGNTDVVVYRQKSYSQNDTNVVIDYVSHSYTIGDNVYVDFISGNTTNDGIYNVTSTTANTINITIPITVLSSGNLLIGNLIA